MTKLMKKVILMMCVMIFMFMSICFADTELNYVKVRIRYPRLYNEKAYLTGYDDIYVYELGENMQELFELNSTYICAKLDADGAYHIAFSDIYSSFGQAKEMADDLSDCYGVNFFPYYDKYGFKVYSGFYGNKNDGKNLLSKLIDEGYDAEIVNTAFKNVAVYDKNDKAVFMYDNNADIYFTSYYDAESIDMIKIEGKPYRGYMGFKIIEDSKLISINYVELESYLYGVVPNEIVSSWGIESLKAQAVAARTYAIYNQRPYSLYDMEDNQNSQVYRGYNSEKVSTDKAVDETCGKMIYYDNKLIQAFYHSSSGGSTENSENVWTTYLPYAVGVDDPYSDRSGSPYNEWQKSITKNEIIKMLVDDGNNVRDLYSVEITSVSENNRVMECIFSTDIGEISYKKENARLLLGLMSSWFDIINGNIFYFTNEYTLSNEKEVFPSRSGGVLDSIISEASEEDVADNFKKLDSGGVSGKSLISDSGTTKVNKDVLSVISSTGVSTLKTDSSTYNFEGRGWGHGIGMSQYGAKQMAEEGFDYEEILKYYYTGVTVK